MMITFYNSVHSVCGYKHAATKKTLSAINAIASIHFTQIKYKYHTSTTTLE